VIETYLPGTFSEFKNASCIFAFRLSYPQDIAVSSNYFFLFVPVSFTECLIDENNLTVHIGDIDAVVGAHNSPGE